VLAYTGYVGVIERSENVQDGPLLVEGNTAIIPTARGLRVARIGKQHIFAAKDIGLVPILVVDIIGLFGVNLDMISKLSSEKSSD
jgi:hypothetical protein